MAQGEAQANRRSQREQAVLSYSDGSGGKFSSHPDIRRCGRAWIRMDHNHELQFAKSSELEGERQTVARAELAAVIDAMTQLPKAAELEAVVDASYVVKTGSRIIRALDTALMV